MMELVRTLLAKHISLEPLGFRITCALKYDNSFENKNSVLPYPSINVFAGAGEMFKTRSQYYQKQTRIHVMI